jgi:hypothetical protein
MEIQKQKQKNLTRNKGILKILKRWSKTSDIGDNKWIKFPVVYFLWLIFNYY